MSELEIDMLTGHQGCREKLFKLFLDENVQGSYLFSGMESIGKKLTALWFARLVNCQGTEPGCGICQSCKKISKNLHPDVRIIAKAKDKTVITIDQVRLEIIEEANYKPFEGKYRVFIIDDAHLLNDQAQNALLKALEESGSRIIAILITSRPSDLLPTVVSRCKQIKFFPLSDEDIRKILLKYPDLPEEKIQLLISSASGSAGKAVSLVSDESYWKRRGIILDLLQRLPDADLNDILEFSDSLKIARSDVENLESMFEIILSWFRDISFVHSGLGKEFLINRDYSHALEDMIYCYTLEDIISVQELLLEVRKLVFENNLNIKFALQRLFIKAKNAGTVKI